MLTFVNICQVTCGLLVKAQGEATWQAAQAGFQQFLSEGWFLAKVLSKMDVFKRLILHLPKFNIDITPEKWMGMEDFDFLLGSSNFSGTFTRCSTSVGYSKWDLAIRPLGFQASLGHAGKRRATVVSYGSALSAMERRGVWQEVRHPREEMVGFTGESYRDSTRWCTPPKFNVEPENTSLQKESPFGHHYF